MSDHPTAASILAAVHGVKSRVGGLRGKRWKDIDPNHFESEFNTVNAMGVMGGAEKLDDGFKESMKYAAELETMMRKKAN